MASTEVKIVMGAQDQEQVAAYDRLVARNRELEHALMKTGKAGAKAGKDTKDAFQPADGMFSRLAGQAGGFLAALGGIATSLALARKELQAIQTVRLESLNQQLGVSQQWRSLYDTLPQGANLSKEQLTEKLLAGTTLPLKTQLPVAIAASKEAGERTDLGVASAITAGRLAPHLDVGQLSELASGTVSMVKQNPKLTVDQAAAQLIATSRKSESSIGEVSKALGPAVGRFSAFAPGTQPGDVAAFGLALEGTMDTGIGPALEFGEKVTAALTKNRKGPLPELLAAAQNDPQLKAAIIASARSPESKLAARELVSGGKAFQAFDQLRGELGGDAAAVLAREEANATAVRRQPNQLAAEVDRIMTANTERLLSDPKNALLAQREKLIKGLTSTGAYQTTTEVEAMVDSAISPVYGGPAGQLEALHKRIGGRRAELEAPKRQAFLGFQHGPLGAEFTGAPAFRPPSERDLEMARSLKTMENSLQELIDIMRENQGRAQPVVFKTVIDQTRGPLPSPAGRMSDR